MTGKTVDQKPALAVRKDVFRTLVEIQDSGVPVATSRQLIAERFALTPEIVQTIEEEGLEKEWPPLN